MECESGGEGGYFIQLDELDASLDGIAGIRTLLASDHLEALRSREVSA